MLRATLFGQNNLRDLVLNIVFLLKQTAMETYIQPECFMEQLILTLEQEP